MSAESKKVKKRKGELKDETIVPEHNSLIDTARSGFTVNVDNKYHLNSIHGKDAADGKDQNASFIAQSEMIVAKGVTVRLHDGTELKHVPGTTEDYG